MLYDIDVSEGSIQAVMMTPTQTQTVQQAMGANPKPHAQEMLSMHTCGCCSSTGTDLLPPVSLPAGAAPHLECSHTVSTGQHRRQRGAVASLPQVTSRGGSIVTRPQQQLCHERAAAGVPGQQQPATARVADTPAGEPCTQAKTQHHRQALCSPPQAIDTRQTKGFIFWSHTHTYELGVVLGSLLVELYVPWVSWCLVQPLLVCLVLLCRAFVAGWC